MIFQDRPSLTTALLGAWDKSDWGGKPSNPPQPSMSVVPSWEQIATYDNAIIDWVIRYTNITSCSPSVNCLIPGLFNDAFCVFRLIALSDRIINSLIMSFKRCGKNDGGLVYLDIPAFVWRNKGKPQELTTAGLRCRDFKPTTSEYELGVKATRSPK